MQYHLFGFSMCHAFLFYHELWQLVFPFICVGLFECMNVDRILEQINHKIWLYSIFCQMLIVQSLYKLTSRHPFHFCKLDIHNLFKQLRYAPMKSRVIILMQNYFHSYNLFNYLLFTNKTTCHIALFESGMQRSFLSCRVWHKYIGRETYILIYLMHWYSKNYTIWPLNENFLLLKMYDEQKV